MWTLHYHKRSVRRAEDSQRRREQKKTGVRHCPDEDGDSGGEDEWPRRKQKHSFSHGHRTQSSGTVIGHSPWTQPEVTDLCFFEQFIFVYISFYFFTKAKMRLELPLPPSHLSICLTEKTRRFFDTFPIYSLSLEKCLKKKTTQIISMCA